MAKLKKLKYIDEESGELWHHQFLYWCEGCDYEHAFSPEIHQFNGDINNPTISPSLLLSNPQQHRICHSFIKEGKIQYLPDCWHHLAGQTIELPDVDQKIEERKNRVTNNNGH